MKTQKEIRVAFWATHPDLPRRRPLYAWTQPDKAAEVVYPTDTRCAFVDYVDQLQKSGEISKALAFRATL